MVSPLFHASATVGSVSHKSALIAEEFEDRVLPHHEGFPAAARGIF